MEKQGFALLEIRAMPMMWAGRVGLVWLLTGQSTTSRSRATKIFRQLEGDKLISMMREEQTSRLTWPNFRAVALLDYANA